MTTQLWTEVDDYITQLIAPPDPALAAALEASADAGLPAIQVSPVPGDSGTTAVSPF